MTDPQAGDPLLACILARLAPLLSSGCLADAANAAKQAIAAYNAAGADQLLSIAQIVGFSFASLDSLTLSAEPDLSVAMKLRLRGNANALNRSTHRSTAALEAQRRDNPALHPPLCDDAQPHTEAPTEAQALAALEQARIALSTPEPQPGPARAAPAPEPAPTAPEPAPHIVPQAASQSSSQDRKTVWATAMTEIAAECSRNLARLPPKQRRTEIIRINALSDTARYLARGGATPSKSDLLNTTSLTA